jgi:hypothetical protein
MVDKEVPRISSGRTTGSSWADVARNGEGNGTFGNASGSADDSPPWRRSMRFSNCDKKKQLLVSKKVGI